MAKEQIATWNDSIGESSVRREASVSIINTMITLVDEIDGMTSGEIDDVIEQIFNIANTLVAVENLRFMAATTMNQLILVFQDTDRVDAVIGEVFTTITTLMGSDEWYVRQVAANALGQVATTVSGLGKIQTYAIPIVTLFNSAAEDAVGDVKSEAADALGPMIETFVGAFDPTPAKDAYITQLYGVIVSLIGDDVANVRKASAQAMLRVITALASVQNLGTHAAQTLTVVNSLLSDSEAGVRSVSIEILKPLTIAISSMPAYQGQVPTLLGMLNNLTFDESEGVKTDAVASLQSIIVAVGIGVVPSVLTIVKFETLINIDLLNYSDAGIRDAVISAIPGKLTEYDSRIDADADVITNNLDSIMGLLAIIGDVSEEDAANVQAAAASAKETLSKIVDNITVDNIETVADVGFDIIKKINSTFDDLVEQSTYTKTFLEAVLHKVLAGGEEVSHEVKVFTANCVNISSGGVATANVNQLIFADDATTVELSWLGDALNPDADY